MTDKKPYFPCSGETPACDKCDKMDCHSRGKYQRDRVGFSYTSGRCPRLPDRYGFVEKEERALYAETFPLVHAERDGDGVICLSLSRTGKPVRRISITHGQWWFRDKLDGMSVRRVVSIDGVYSKADLEARMGNGDYCIFRCDIEDYFI